MYICVLGSICIEWKRECIRRHSFNIYKRHEGVEDRKVKASVSSADIFYHKNIHHKIATLMINNKKRDDDD